MALVNLYDLSYEQLTAQTAEWGISAYYADLIWRAIYEKRIATIDDIALENPKIQQKLAENGTLIRPKALSCIDSTDGFTRKYLLQYPDGHSIETVIMEFDTRYTACVSTQVGCAMGCVFCATGQMGYTRHLTPGEVVAQILHVQDDLASRGKELRNLVFMGMGEPLHNYDNLLTSIDILTHRKGIDLAPKHITVSTVGLPDRIRDLADAGDSYPVHLGNGCLFVLYKNTETADLF